MTRLWRNLRRSIERRIGWGADRREPVHFLHIGKNAGTQVGLIAEQINAAGRPVRIVKHGHTVSLRDLPPGDRYFFSIRNPESRFVSGFYSRKRKGQPRIYSEWTAHEAEAFRRFEHANNLAEALSGDDALGRSAFFAMKSISHLSMNQLDWFDRSGLFLDLRPPVFILRTEHFEPDLRELIARLGLEFRFELSRDDVRAHRNDYSQVPALSEKARTNLRDWYRLDFAFYRHCEDWILRQTDAAR
jgi:hypothetical protein